MTSKLENKKNSKPFFIAIGASAGGLEALSSLVSHLPSNLGYYYVVAQHCAPDRQSLLPELLSHKTTLPVVALEDITTPEPDTLYVVTADHDAVIENGRIIMLSPMEKNSARPNINRLFNSLAVSEGSQAVGIILSGTGNDGTSGLIAIKSAEGVTIAQDPTTASYEVMPLTSIQAHAVDIVLSPEAIAQRLEEICRGNLEFSNRTSSPSEHVAYHKIIQLTHKQSGLDLAQYKPSTISRRIHRRMEQNNIHKMEDYAKFLEQTDGESAQFISDVLIPVTEFFRDESPFEKLSENIQKMVNEHHSNEPIRIWVAGCATGEEAYSIAILMEEARKQCKLTDNRYNFSYQIFATDLDEASLQVARVGSYAKETLQNLPYSLLQSYFSQKGDQCQIIDRIRNQITFARHNLIKEPPFSRINLISCRNLLIYFNSVLQKQINDVFHYSLLSNGILFLGISEAVNDNTLFDCLNKSARLYQKKPLSHKRITLPFMHFPVKSIATSSLPTHKQEQEGELENIIFRELSKHFSPASAIIDDHNKIHYITDDAKDFLQFRGGDTDLLIFSLINSALQAELKALLYKMRRLNMQIEGNTHKLSEINKQVENSSELKIQLVVTPFSDIESKWAIISFVSHKEPTNFICPDDVIETNANESVNSHRAQQLEQELTATQETLQTVIQELETANIQLQESNEELQIINEELQSSNEELQTTNEELQSTNEELQSTNEELLTVNDEIQQKNILIATNEVNAQVTLNAISDAVLRLDKNMEVIYFNQRVQSFINISHNALMHCQTSNILPLINEDNASPIDYFSFINSPPNIAILSQNNSVKHIEFQITSFTHSDSEGFVLVFRDVSERVQIEKKIQWENKHDSLTGLVNRHELFNRLELAISRTKQYAQKHALLFLDLDQFKLVNDSCGHLAGDELLSQLSHKLSESIRSRDTLARLGGDEFAILIENCPVEQAEYIADNIIKQVNDFRFTYENKLFRIGISIGIALVTDSTQSPQEILSQADAACYGAKDAGRNQVKVIGNYEDGDVNVHRQIMQTSLIHQSLEQDNFGLFFQPIVATQNSNGSLWEVLIRMRGKDDSDWLLPGSFLPIAERFNIADKIDCWVFSELCKTLIENQAKDQGDKLPIICINLSGQTIIQKELTEFFIQKIESTGIAPNKFCFEVTETAAISRFHQALKFINKLKEIGCLFSLDDFGSGMSSFGYLRQLPIDFLKIDGDIVKDIKDDLLDLTIVESIHQIAQVIDVMTIAEFVETENIKDKLTGIGIDYLQGFYFSRPISSQQWLHDVGLKRLN
ncbi:MAG: EAL domain-containing protein [Gammaproteobacteria bacterium]|nr:EAL domain-containing protein [Gammaproteobacteria bacterium]